MDPARAAGFFTHSDGVFRFARWGRAPAPVVFGTDDDSLAAIKDAIRAVAALGDMPLAETDPEIGANLMIFFLRDWAELAAIPDLGEVTGDAAALAERLEAAGANQYRLFRHDAEGAIRLCVILLRQDEALAALTAQALATAQMARAMLLWSDRAFERESPVANLSEGGPVIVRPEIAALIRAAYDPVLPSASRDAALAHRLAARAGLLLGDLADEG